MMSTIQTLGIASSLGGPFRTSRNSAELVRDDFNHNAGQYLQWHMLYPERRGSKDYQLIQLYRTASHFTQYWTSTHTPFLVIGGDHSCAIGTWSGVLRAMPAASQFGLIWLDAHMDAHTFATSPSGNIHGMPVAVLLGKGDPRLARFYPAQVFIDPEKLILIGVRSYEQAEYALLTDAHVGLVYAHQISAAHGLLKVLRGAVDQLSFSCKKIAISIDLDVIDPVDAPGVETPAPGGIKAEELLISLAAIARHPKICALEISEYNPDNDRNNKTLHLIKDIIGAFYGLSNANKSLGSLRSGTNGISVPI